MQEHDNLPIALLDLSKRTYHVLIRARILTIGKLKEIYLNKNKDQIFMIGEKSWEEISKAINKLRNTPNYLKVVKKAQAELPIERDNQTETENGTSINILSLQPSIRSRLKNHGIRTVDDLRRTSDRLLLNIKGVGPRKLAEIKENLATFYSNPSTPAPIQKSIPIAEKKPITWAQIVEDYFRFEKDVYTYILISRFGFTPKTLEELATYLGVTRERVRQIQEAAAVRYIKHLRFSGAMALLEKVENIFSSYGEELSLASLNALLKKEDILGQFSDVITTKHIKRLDLLETLICWLNLLTNKRYSLLPLEFSIDISELTRSGNISIKDHAILMSISKNDRRKIKRKVLFTGGITVKEATKFLAKGERVTELVLKNIGLQKIDNEWFSYKKLDRGIESSKIPIRVAGLKMSAISPNMDINSFHDGLRRYASRFYNSIAPIHIIEHFLIALGFEIKEARVSTQLTVKDILSQSEKSLISAITKNGGIASFLEITEEFFLQKLSLPAVSVTLKRSPVAEKVDDGLYKLRGTDISWNQIEAAKKRQKRFTQDAKVTHGLDGVVRMKFTVNSYAFLTGVVWAYSVKELAGSWSIIHKDKSYGDAKIDETYLWGLAKLFKELDVKMGDRIELAFNTWNRTISVRKVHNENS